MHDTVNERYSFVGRTEDGRGIYRSNYPKNTPKAQKQKDIIDLVQNVWSKKPIKLNLILDGETVEIEARFNPELTERSDLAKIAFGNRKGTNSEKRITLNPSSDLYQIAEESRYVRSKTETGKDNPAHFGVSQWHYFVTDLVYVEEDGVKIECYMNIDVKQNDNGNWFYSFAIEKGTAPRTLLAGVTEDSATVPNNIILKTEEKSNTFEKNSSKKSSDINERRSTTDRSYLDEVERGDLESAQKMVDEAAKKAGYTIKAYHGTPNTEFTVFDKGRLGKGNDQYGAGFYFATDKEAASHYGRRVIDSVLSIDNPIRMTANASTNNLIQADITLTSKQAYEVVKRFPNIYDEENSPLGDYFDSYWEVGAQDWMIRELAEQYRNIGLLDSDLFRYYPNELHEALRDIVGYDGVEVAFENSDEKFYVAWFDNQIKSAEAVTYDDNGSVIPLSKRFDTDNIDIRYSKTGNQVDNGSKTRYNNTYTEHQYNSFGWVRANEILTSDQYKDFTQKFAQIKNGKNKNYVKSASGSYIIAIGGTNDGYGFGIDNILVYATGTIAYPKVKKIVKIDLYSEDDIEIVREVIYEQERYKNTQASYFAENYFGQEIVHTIAREDLPDYQRYQSEARARRSGGESGRAYKSYITKQDGERDSGEAQADRSINDRSSKTGRDTVEMSRGEIAKFRANYTSDKTFNKRKISEALNDISLISKLPANVRNDLVQSLWKGFNEHRAYDIYSKVMTEQIYATVMQETGFELEGLDTKDSKDAANIFMQI